MPSQHYNGTTLSHLLASKMANLWKYVFNSSASFYRCMKNDLIWNMSWLLKAREHLVFCYIFLTHEVSDSKLGKWLEIKWLQRGGNQDFFFVLLRNEKKKTPISMFCFLSLLYTATQKTSRETLPFRSSPLKKSATYCSTEVYTWQDRVAHYIPTTLLSQQTEHLWKHFPPHTEYFCFIIFFL